MKISVVYFSIAPADDGAGRNPELRGRKWAVSCAICAAGLARVRGAALPNLRSDIELGCRDKRARARAPRLRPKRAPSD